MGHNERDNQLTFQERDGDCDDHDDRDGAERHVK